MRVFELAKQIGTSSKEVLLQLDKMGHPGLTHMSSIDEAITKQILKKKLPTTPALSPTRRQKSQPAPEVKTGQEKKRILLKRRKLETKSTTTTQLPVSASELITPSPQDTRPSIGTVSDHSKPSPVISEQMISGSEHASETPLAQPLTPEDVAPPKTQDHLPTSLTTPSPSISAEHTSDTLHANENPIPPPPQPTIVTPAEKAPKPPKPVAKRTGDVREDATRWKDLRTLPSLRREERSRPASSTHPTDGTRPRKKIIKLSDGLSVKSFAEAIGQKPTDVIRKLMASGVMLTLNQPIDSDAAVLVADLFGLKVEVTTEQPPEELLQDPEDAPESLLPRPPVVTIMGHVDHGKTSLLDVIRKTKVIDSEAGGITQHIGAYTTKLGDKPICFLDTPGHEAFTAIRARGSKIADLVLLVVAADDGVMSQTLEAINHAKAADIPIIAVINKMDQPDANPERVRSVLAEHGLIPESWGGQTIYAEVSAKQGTGIENLLELILLQAEILDLKANPARLAKGVVIDARLDRGRGPIATLLVQMGTLKVGDAFLVGAHSGRVRALLNDEGRKITEATSSMPVEVIGIPMVPQSGDIFLAVKDEKVAREIAKRRQEALRTQELNRSKRLTLDDIYTNIQDGNIKDLNLVIKADVQGTTEALAEALGKIDTPTVKLNIIHSGIGGITESDVLLASASRAIIIGFNIRPEPKAARVAERESIDIRLYNIIYNAINDVKAAMEGLLAPIVKERIMGRAEVRQTFSVPKAGTVAGSYVVEGLISRASEGIRVIRDNVVVYQGTIGSLRRFKDDVREASMGYECGIGVQNFNDIKVGDVLETFQMEEDTTRRA
ncbi:MAG: translation initiation factor IF-2 [Nitrospiraceae bacterium]|nr:translation initiation factor IF-2 [Nitrospiraceae bacterium]